ncbi:MAG: hypothetical protein CL959_01810 [Euryarchaeota archaeon]|nr:hypothetical protein [Euryarchaeota archaeon]|tara:strand:+ start:384 stop:629 length:246 start_codon:yes stop_codon:yes gene_type:complete
MNPTAFTYGWMAGLIILYALFPKECDAYFFGLYAIARIKYWNGMLLLRSWLAYRSLRNDFKEMGVELPPFKFTPLQDRDHG